MEPDPDGYLSLCGAGGLLQRTVKLGSGRSTWPRGDHPRSGVVSRIDASLSQEGLTEDLVLVADPISKPLDYSELQDGYGRDRVWANVGRVGLTFVIVTPVVLFFAGFVVLVAGLARGGFRDRARRPG